MALASSNSTFPRDEFRRELAKKYWSLETRRRETKKKFYEYAENVNAAFRPENKRFWKEAQFSTRLEVAGLEQQTTLASLYRDYPESTAWGAYVNLLRILGVVTGRKIHFVDLNLTTSADINAFISWMLDRADRQGRLWFYESGDPLIKENLSEEKLAEEIESLQRSHAISLWRELSHLEAMGIAINWGSRSGGAQDPEEIEALNKFLQSFSLSPIAQEPTDSTSAERAPTPPFSAHI